jgi:uncharacterized membrane protein YeaQ/YmgE (transglycosylase-associated protein family)
MSLIAFIIFGLVVGLIARAIMPGRQGMGLVVTAVLGMAGAIAGGLVGSLFGGHGFFDLHPAGLVGSVIGALAILFIMGMTGRGPRARPT